MKLDGTTGVLSVLALITLQSVATAQATFDRSKPPEPGPPPRVSLTSTIRRVASGMAALIPSANAQAVASSSKTTMACADDGEPGSRPQ